MQYHLFSRMGWEKFSKIIRLRLVHFLRPTSRHHLGQDFTSRPCCSVVRKQIRSNWRLNDSITKVKIKVEDKLCLNVGIRFQIMILNLRSRIRFNAIDSNANSLALTGERMTEDTRGVYSKHKMWKSILWFDTKSPILQLHKTRFAYKKLNSNLFWKNCSIMFTDPLVALMLSFAVETSFRQWPRVNHWCYRLWHCRCCC